MEIYYINLAREQLINCQSALENADAYIARASRNNAIDYGVRKSIAILKKRTNMELVHLSNLIQDKTLSEDD